ncbi:DNA polymerase III subunit epsilon [Niveispirillum cyanobacteriorum]|uniref:DNA polymerase III subunit epsilon n=1 Tax=Niveispirillum cyanobacteriorum TaxID=1612173 RepID=A0A2K9NCS5_9PROT|nr:DNA polymerase III subunit epsilon [Niveispirillum cyanobacteriorum]AUN30889.1 DNA polymerase III subunit epsilon [Niveispirillum cyanobacteriorum]GGE80507.1 DNA polymerase III subunit epsilon [Niveispirillum cyanobacteriorum]
MREIVLDTETTGIDPLNGDRIVEIGCVELFNHIATGQHYHAYLNPERDMPAEAEAVHGLSSSFLSDKPVFPAVVGDFLDFIGDAQLVIHNATFDIGFLNMELVRIGMPKLTNPVVDTVKIARKRFPGAPASLDALCRRFEIDNSNRTLHGALLDSQLLAEVYLELMGGRQPDLVLAGGPAAVQTGLDAGPARVVRTTRPPRPHAPLPDELTAHEAFVKGIKNAAWLAS